MGGTPLYLIAAARASIGPPTGIRRQIEEELAQYGLGLHRRLELVDPLSWRLHPHDKRRIIRQLGSFATGEPIQSPADAEDGTPANQCGVFVLSWSRGPAQADRRALTACCTGIR